MLEGCADKISRYPRGHPALRQISRVRGLQYVTSEHAPDTAAGCGSVRAAGAVTVGFAAVAVLFITGREGAAFSTVCVA
jgi:hypothetical protein